MAVAKTTLVYPPLNQKTPIVLADGTAHPMFLLQMQAQFDRLNDQIAQLKTTQNGTSYTVGLAIASNPVTTTQADIVIGSHQRVYWNHTVTVDGGAVFPLAYDTTYQLYYDDPNQTGGPVAYLVTSDPTVAATSSTHPGHVFLGAVTTPTNSGASPTAGKGGVPPGWPPGNPPP